MKDGDGKGPTSRTCAPRQRKPRIRWKSQGQVVTSLPRRRVLTCVSECLGVRLVLLTWWHGDTWLQLGNVFLHPLTTFEAHHGGCCCGLYSESMALFELFRFFRSCPVSRFLSLCSQFFPGGFWLLAAAVWLFFTRFLWGGCQQCIPGYEPHFAWLSHHMLITSESYRGIIQHSMFASTIICPSYMPQPTLSWYHQPIPHGIMYPS